MPRILLVCLVGSQLCFAAVAYVGLGQFGIKLDEERRTLDQIDLDVDAIQRAYFAAQKGHVGCDSSGKAVLENSLITNDDPDHTTLVVKCVPRDKSVIPNGSLDVSGLPLTKGPDQ